VKTDSRGIPLAKEFGGNRSMVIVQILTEPDGDRRQLIRVCWLSDAAWLPGGVRAKVFNVVPSRWVRDARAEKKTVKMFDGSEVPE